MLPGAGTIVAAIQTATAVAPIVVGKPEPGLFEHGLRRLGRLLPGQVAMIGDRHNIVRRRDGHLNDTAQLDL